MLMLPHQYFLYTQKYLLELLLLIFYLKKNIGYAFIPIDYAKNDTEMEIRSPYANLKAKVVPLPFFDPKKKIPIK